MIDPTVVHITIGGCALVAALLVFAAIYIGWRRTAYLQSRPPRQRNSCEVCGCVAIPGRGICPECKYPNAAIAPDPYEEDPLTKSGHSGQNSSASMSLPTSSAEA